MGHTLRGTMLAGALVALTATANEGPEGEILDMGCTPDRVEEMRRQGMACTETAEGIRPVPLDEYEAAPRATST